MKGQAQSSDLPGFTVRLLGTPAEESGGGKVKLIEAGAYKDVDACLMVHPVPMSPNRPDVHGIATVVEGGYLANNKVKVTFTGKPSHAAAAPWEGINALDAVVSAYVNISLLRQQILPSQKIHGVIVNGGDRPNVIPMSASVDYYIRSPTKKTLKPLTEKVINCFEAAATATGCKVEYEWYGFFSHGGFFPLLIENFSGVLVMMTSRAIRLSARAMSQQCGRWATILYSTILNRRVHFQAAPQIWVCQSISYMIRAYRG